MKCVEPVEALRNPPLVILPVNARFFFFLMIFCSLSLHLNSKNQLSNRQFKKFCTFRKHSTWFYSTIEILRSQDSIHAWKLFQETGFCSTKQSPFVKRLSNLFFLLIELTRNQVFSQHKRVFHESEFWLDKSKKIFPLKDLPFNILDEFKSSIQKSFST